jgi:hypothetical protein
MLSLLARSLMAVGNTAGHGRLLVEALQNSASHSSRRRREPESAPARSHPVGAGASPAIPPERPGSAPVAPGPPDGSSNPTRCRTTPRPWPVYRRSRSSGQRRRCCRSFGLDRQVHQRAGRHRHSHGKAVQLSSELGDRQAKRLGSAGISCAPRWRCGQLVALTTAPDPSHRMRHRRSHAASRGKWRMSEGRGRPTVGVKAGHRSATDRRTR